MPARGQRLSEAQRERVREGTRRGRISQLARKRVLALVAKGDVERLIESQTVVESLRPFADIYAAEILELVEARGGVSQLSPQERMLIEDTATLGLIARALRAVFLQTSDHEIASKVGTLLGQRRVALTTLGLQRVALDIPEELSEERLEAARLAQYGEHAPSGESVAGPEAQNAGQTNGGGREPLEVEQGELVVVPAAAKPLAERK
jgi:hypothetical protein